MNAAAKRLFSEMFEQDSAREHSDEDKMAFNALRMISKVARHRAATRFEMLATLVMASRTFASHWPERWEDRDVEVAYCQATAEAASHILNITDANRIKVSLAKAALLKPKTADSKVARFSTMLLTAVAQEQALYLVTKDTTETTTPSPKVAQAPKPVVPPGFTF